MSTNSIILAKLLATGLEPVLLKEPDFKSDVSTTSTKRAMAQFDIMVLFNTMWVLSLTLLLNYALLMNILIPVFFELRKFTFKKVKT
jgi:hypothetical protein